MRAVVRGAIRECPARLRAAWWGYVEALVGVALASGAIGLALHHLRIPNLALLYLLVVLVVATRHGQVPAILAAFTAFLVYDYFFVGPPHRFTFLRPREGAGSWIALLLFLATAAVTGRLAAMARRRAATAERHAREALLLAEVAWVISVPDGPDDLAPALSAVTERLRRLFRLADVAIDLPPAAGPGAAGDEPPGPWRTYPIRSAGRPVGALRLRLPGDAPPFDDDEARLLAAVAAQLGVAVERIRLRREAAAAALLRRADEVKSALLAAVSHDLRTPLASIITAAEILRQEDEPWQPESRRTLTAVIEGEARRLNRIVTNLLDLSRIEAGGLCPQRGWYDLGAVIDEALERLRPALASHRLVVDVADTLPPAPLDYVQIDQVLANLVENAAKYAPAGTEIRVEARREPDGLTVTVADRGPGIPLAALPYLFTPFYRVVAPEPGPYGTGLGLAVAKGLVEAHGGRIWVANRSGGGARFTFSLPMQAPVARPAAGERVA